MAAGKWTVEISPYGPQDPATDRSPRVFASDTISVAFDDEPRRLERWERVGSRLRSDPVRKSQITCTPSAPR